MSVVSNREGRRGVVLPRPLPREAAAKDAGVSPEGSGFRGVSFHYIVYIVASRETVNEVIDAAAWQWGGCFGYFSDPDGYLWKVASPS